MIWAFDENYRVVRRPQEAQPWDKGMECLFSSKTRNTLLVY